MILSVGYRVNSKKATQFRHWATETLRQHITEGYTINPARIRENYEAFLQAVADIKALLPAGGEVDAGSALELIKLFADTWFSIDAYDREIFSVMTETRESIAITGADLHEALQVFKTELIKK